ncbi:hypothetical protein D6C00_11915 [Thiohalobacter thiocyanaticus]|uniref:Uncharacterized protein n=1 Tax=Thiohalobacter thiocyanaticus TaxID=585455 RepID=A0A426QLD7_9GAMM|nr:hypothetical protein D6C00_11915 [Thiohalobacter thiocyanaticus]
MLRRIIRSWPVSSLFLLCFTGPAVAGAPGAENDSVHSWGRWETLAPAAGGVPDVSALQLETGVELRPGDAAVLTPGFRSEPPAGGDNGGGSEPPARAPLPPITKVNPDQPVVNVPSPPPPAPGAAVRILSPNQTCSCPGRTQS